MAGIDLPRSKNKLLAMKYPFYLLSLFALMFITSCTEDDDPVSPTPTDPGLNVPSTYVFTDADGNSTVSFNGQAQRLEMLSEMVTYMKTANTAGVAVDADQLKDMYANSGITWADAPGLGMTGSSKQLKSKTAAAGGTADPAVQAYFEAYMDEIAALSQTTVTGENNGAAGQGGVVVSTSNPSKQYLQSAEGVEYGQVIEKGLMGAVFYNQIAMHYLGDAEMAGDNSTAVDPDNGKYYTEMEHAWDEAFGYFTTATDYAAGGNGIDRFWGKYADKREALLGSATKISTAFRTGRAAIAAGDMAERDAQRAIIRTELEKVVAGTAIHYLNSSVENFADDALRNHALSEAIAFISDLPYGHEPIASQSQVMQWFFIIGADHYEVTTADLLNVRDQIATAAGMEDIKEEL